MSTSYKPDAIVNLETEDGTLTVYLAVGGEQFPWAAHKGRVIIGPPDGTLTSDGASTESLEWNVDPYWVVEALDLKGDPVDLRPDQYTLAIQKAVAQKGAFHSRPYEA